MMTFHCNSKSSPECKSISYAKILRNHIKSISSKVTVLGYPPRSIMSLVLGS